MTAPIRENLSGLDLRAEIDRLRKDRNAVILAHYYQKPEIQDLADFVGDSLELSRKAAETDADVIAFCGVKFMADTYPNVGRLILERKALDDEIRGLLDEAIAAYNQSWAATRGA